MLVSCSTRPVCMQSSSLFAKMSTNSFRAMRNCCCLVSRPSLLCSHRSCTISAKGVAGDAAHWSPVAIFTKTFREARTSVLSLLLLLWSSPVEAGLWCWGVCQARCWRWWTPCRARNCDRFGRIRSQNLICATSKYNWEHSCKCK